MAADLAASPTTGIEVMCCGDAHVSNFGLYAAPHRSIVFDLNDFDEAAVAPAEWDVKRLITSAIVGGRHAGYPAKAIGHCVKQALESYRTGLHAMLDMDVLDRYYLRVEPENYSGPVSVSKDLVKVIERTTSRARTRTSARVVKQIVRPDPTAPLGFGRRRRFSNTFPAKPKTSCSSRLRSIWPQSRSTSRFCCRTFASPMSRCGWLAWAASAPGVT